MIERGRFAERRSRRFAAAMWALAIGVLPGDGMAQAAPIRGVGLEISGLRHGQLDRAASPLRYAGEGAAAGVVWFRPAPGSRLEVGGWFGTGRLESAAASGGRPSEDLWIGGLRVRYLRRVAGWGGGRVEVFAGGDITAHASVRVHRYPVEGTEPFADLLIPLSAAGGWEWDAGPLRVGQRLLLPVAGVVARSPYGGLKYVPPFRFAWGWELAGFGHELSAEAAVAPVLDVRATWSLSVMHHDDPRRIDLATHRLSLVASLRGRPR